MANKNSKKKGQRRPKSRKTKVSGAHKASVKKLKEAVNPCCPIIRVTVSGATKLDAKTGKSYHPTTVSVGKKSRHFKDGYEADKYVEEAKTALDAKRCRPVVDVIEKAPPKVTRY